MRVLQLCKKFPFPLKDGESIAVTYLSRAMVSLGCEVTLLSMNTSKHYVPASEIPKEFDHYTAIYTSEIDNAIKPHQAFFNLFSSKSYHVSRFVSKAFEKQLVELLETNSYDVIQLETLYLAPYIEIIKKHSDAIISMRAHNIEFEIWERITKNTAFLPKKLYLNHLTKKLRKYELERLNEYDYLVAVSDRDLQQFKKLGYKNGAMATPIGLEMNNYIRIQPTPSKSICFIGALDWIPNREGLDWFLAEVWPLLHEADPDLKFHIAGRNTPQDLLNLDLKNVHIHGEVPDAIEFINASDIMVVPLFSGSGMRVKILEGMALKKTIVTTTLGKEGIEAQDNVQLVIADAPAQFKEKIISLLAKPEELDRIGYNAQEFVKEYYDNVRIAQKLLDKYQYLIEHPYKK